MDGREVLLSVVAASALLAGPAAAEPMRWDGTLSFEFASQALAPLVVTGSGVATVNGSSGGEHLTKLRLAGGLTGSAVVPVTDPEVTVDGVVAVQAVVSVGTGTLEPFALLPPGLTKREVPLRGFVGLCLFDPSCLPGGALPLQLSQPGQQAAVGVGGLLTAGGFGSIRISALAAPWTIDTAVLTVTTASGATVAVPASGSVHGALSFTTSTAIPGGQISLVTPLRVTSEDGTAFTLFSRLTVRFAPEPGFALLLAAGLLGLAILARVRPRAPTTGRN